MTNETKAQNALTEPSDLIDERWSEVSTGGGCMALAFDTADDGVVLATYMADEIPRVGEPVDVGFYDKDGQQVAIFTIPIYHPSVLVTISAMLDTKATDV